MRLIDEEKDAVVKCTMVGQIFPGSLRGIEGHIKEVVHLPGNVSDLILITNFVLKI